MHIFHVLLLYGVYVRPDWFASSRFADELVDAATDAAKVRVVPVQKNGFDALLHLFICRQPKRGRYFLHDFDATQRPIFAEYLIDALTDGTTP